MSETYYAGSYWLSRPESAHACAHRAERFFHLLGRCDPAWGRWYEAADSFEQARKLQFATDAANFQKLFVQKDNHFGDRFSFHVWTGDTLYEWSSVDGHCGSSSLRLPSTCVLKPYDEWGLVTSEAHRDSVTERVKPGTFVGWVMYFSRLRGTVPPLPAPVRIESVEDKGTLVILTPDRFTASNPEHVALANRIHELLDRAELLRPLQPWSAD
jgi:hypothetical protein